MPLLERMPVFAKYASEAPTAQVSVSSPAKKNEEVWMMDLLGDHISAPLIDNPVESTVKSMEVPVKMQTPANISPFGGDLLLDIYNPEPEFSDFQAATPNLLEVLAFEDTDIAITLRCSKGENPADTSINCVSMNKTRAEISDFRLFSAVQKHLSMNISSASSTRMGPGEQITQQIVITNTQQGAKSIVIRLKIDYNINGAPKTNIATVDSFPSTY